MKLNLVLNGESRQLEIDPGAVLLDALRDAGLTGAKAGCREGHCGACIVLVNGRPVNSCLMLAANAEGTAVTTVEALGSPTAPHPIQQAFVDAGAVQCGFCTPGMVLSAKVLLDERPSPTREEIREALAGNLCRCTGYTRIYEAVELAARRMAGEEGTQ